MHARVCTHPHVYLCVCMHACVVYIWGSLVCNQLTLSITHANQGRPDLQSVALVRQGHRPSFPSNRNPDWDVQTRKPKPAKSNKLRQTDVHQCVVKSCDTRKRHRPFTSYFVLSSVRWWQHRFHHRERQHGQRQRAEQHDKRKKGACVDDVGPLYGQRNGDSGRKAFVHEPTTNANNGVEGNPEHGRMRQVQRVYAQSLLLSP